jgi:exopolyphosphatase/guanosine-5'-triphosphate,3'-diphosphate pyrophosphatase
MESHIVGRLKPTIAGLLSGKPALAVGLAGTVTTISGIKQGLDQYDTERIHHSRLSRGEVEEIFMKLATVPLEERKRVMGLEPARADVIVGGAAVLRVIMDLAGLDEILVSEKDILDGLVLDLYHRVAV